MIGALKGPLHGGAPGPVLDMLDAMGHPDAAPSWIAAALDRGERIMGMGHRIYRVRDPRAFVLERAIGELEGSGIAEERLALARAVEKAAEAALAAQHPERPLRANVEFYTAVLLEALGIPRAMFTAIFACSRVAGWCAHIDEQRGRSLDPARVALRRSDARNRARGLTLAGALEHLVDRRVVLQLVVQHAAESRGLDGEVLAEDRPVRAGLSNEQIPDELPQRVLRILGQHRRDEVVRDVRQEWDFGAPRIHQRVGIFAQPVFVHQRAVA